jgi:hypothetical protein
MKLETHYSEHGNQLIRMYNAAEFSVGKSGLAFCTIYPHTQKKGLPMPLIKEF